MSYENIPNLPELVAKKAQLRQSLREEFIKQMYNPHRHATGTGGTVFDPALQRYTTMSYNRYRYFKPTTKTAFYGMAIIVLPMYFGITQILGYRHELEDQLRSGQIAYKDRRSKFV